MGNDSPLYVKPERDLDPTGIADELNLPIPIRRRLLHGHKQELYGEGKSIQIWLGEGGRNKTSSLFAVPKHQIMVADLSDWSYPSKKGTVAVDPVLGRIAFPLRYPPKNGVWVSYHYGFCANIGGGEYDRPIRQQELYSLYRVGVGGEFTSLNAAIKKWQDDAALPNANSHAVIEIVDSGVYVEQINIAFKDNQKSLQLRAANKKRPVIRLLDWQTDKPDSLTVIGNQNNHFTFDGILVTGRGMQVSGNLSFLTIRHSTLVPGWGVGCDCEPQRPAEPSLEVSSTNVCIKIEHSIVGSIQIKPELIEPDSNQETHDVVVQPNATGHCEVNETGVQIDPIRLCISDSIVDATGRELEAIGAPDCTVAHVRLTILRSTIFGLIQVHAIELGENCIFDGLITVARRQQGCLRFSYVTPESRTTRRYQCQPDLVKSAVEENLKRKGITNSLEIEAAKQQEAVRVHPLFNSIRYGTPTYCQLADCCAEEIKSGADDESEMGVFHDLYQPQRLANLRVRLDEYLPSRMDVGVILST